MIWNFVFILILVALNGFFVAAEFAVITARKSRIRLQANERNAAAKQVLVWLENPGYFLGHLDRMSAQGDIIMLTGGIQMQVATMDVLRASKIRIQGV
jgi:CBS domain containing-hemolysin-like protein